MSSPPDKQVGSPGGGKKRKKGWGVWGGEVVEGGEAWWKGGAGERKSWERKSWERARGE